jgi:bifunctional non-homologous end joining protein LigD
LDPTIRSDRAHAEALSTRDLIIDFEATVLGATGLPNFQALRRELAKKYSDRVVYQAFTLSRRARPAPRGLDRAQACAARGAGQRAPKIAYADFVELQDGETVFRHACRLSRALISIAVAYDWLVRMYQ